ncbi:MAG TPA: M20/M25/M40 family metallo-hydrolase [Gemmatimonadaceae bacterium]|nr:M20/M25/M40 family metallo-hydrolase [Gemmatimonadaceae bacterium]
MRRSIPAFVFAALLALPLAAQAPAPAPAAAPRPIDWTALSAEAVNTLSNYLQVNTTNPPGNEMRAITFLRAILEAEGFEVQVLDTAELGPTRGNLYARLKGNGSKGAIALVSHMDVVPAVPAYWSVDPFSGAIKDGFIWGRGALDMKSTGIVQLYAMLALKRSGVPLNRDIVFIGNSDEELEGLGAIDFVKNHRDLLKDVEYLLTEGGSNPVKDGKLEYYGVSVSEKRTFWQQVTVHGVASHGSRPTKQNPVPRLVAALDRIANWQTPLRATPGVAKYFKDISVEYAGQQRAWLADVPRALTDPKARAWLTSNVMWNAILRNTISLTVLTGSNKTNVIPPVASAELDIRLLPDQDTAAFLADLRKVVNDTAVHFHTMFPPKPPLESPIATDLFRAIERASHDRDPNALVTTIMLTGATDRPTYRQAGIVTYGFDAFRTDVADAQKGVHGNDERISVANVGFGVKYLYDVLVYAQ